MIGKTISHYRIVQKLGAGAMVLSRAIPNGWPGSSAKRNCWLR